MIVKRRFIIFFIILIFTFSFAACAKDEVAFDAQREITVVSREDGSGTRGSFTDLFKIYYSDANGKHIDNTTVEAIITNNTAVMLYSVSTNPYAIGYISLGSMNDAVKPVMIDGVFASIESIAGGSYNAARPFNITTLDNISDVTKDFISFILSTEGQAVVEETGYVSVGNNGNYTSSNISGKIVIGGSSSVTPVIEKLKEAYIILNPKVTIEVQQSDSTTGVNSVLEGICDIGMVSRELKESEINQNLSSTKIALDGIVVIVNHNNPTDSLSIEEVRKIFSGEMLFWEELN